MVFLMALTRTCLLPPPLPQQESFKPDLAENMIPSEGVQLKNILSMESTKRNNLFLMDQSTLLTSAGNNVVLLDIETGEARYMAGLDGGGVGAVCPHPDRKHFAVAEKNTVRPLPGQGRGGRGGFRCLFAKAVLSDICRLC